MGVSFSMNPGGTLALNFDQGININLEHDSEEDVMHIYSVLGEEPVDDGSRLDLYSAMLEANLFGHETEGATLAIDSATREILLTRRFDLANTTGEMVHEAATGMVRA